MVPRVEAPPLTSLGSVPLRGVIVLLLVLMAYYFHEVWTAIQSILVICEILFSTRMLNPVVVLLPEFKENRGVADAPMDAPQIGVIDTP